MSARWWRRVPPGRRWAILGIVWLLIVAASAWYGAAHPDYTERDQTTVAQARATVDEAIARVATAVTADGAGVVAVSPLDQVGPCDVSLVREGARYQRGLLAVVTPGTEAGLLTRLAAALPATYKPTVRTGDVPRLTADAGNWVLLTGTVSAPGEVRFAADTGNCRPVGDLDATDPAPSVPADATASVLARLGLTGETSYTASVSCVDGGAVGTVEQRAGGFDGDLAEALADLPGATIIVDQSRLFAFRAGAAQIAVRAHESITYITATTVCASD